MNSAGGGVTPISNVTTPATPQPIINELELTFRKRTDSQKRRSETVVSLGTRYTAKQLVHLLDFCGLKSATRNKLPEIWTNLQDTNV